MVMDSVKQIEKESAHIRQALNNLMYRYEHSPRQLGEKHKLYRSILLLQEELNKLEANKNNTSSTAHR